MDVYGIITERISAALEKGTVPWHRPWASIENAPKNAISKKAYRGINVWMLAGRYESPWWASFRQVKELGGYVRRDEKSTPVIWWNIDVVEPDGDNLDAKPSRRFTLRYYNVFNLEQCELPEKVAARFKPAERPKVDAIEECERIVAAMPNPPRIEHVEARAFYTPSLDRVNMPKRDLFEKAEAYYSVLFHELGHSTGHESRLARPTIMDLCPFGSTNYSKEELVAEMTAAFLCGTAGIENTTVDLSAAYIANWLAKLQDDRKMVVLAAAQAQRAADYILDRKAAEETATEKEAA